MKLRFSENSKFAIYEFGKIRMYGKSDFLKFVNF